MSINIKLEQLSKKPFTVKLTAKNTKKTYQFQLDSAKMKDSIAQASQEVDRSQLTDKELQELEEKEEKQAIKSFQAMIDIQDLVVGYLVDVLKLSEKQADDLEELEQDDLFSISQYVAMRITGMSDADIEEANANQEDEGLPVQENK